MKPRRVSRFSTAWIRCCTPGADEASSIVEIIPHSATRPCSRERVQGGDEMIAADVVEVQVDAVRRGRRQALREARPVVDPLVEAQLVDQQAGLLRAAGAADHPRRAEQPRELARGAAHRAGRRGHEDDVARADVARPAEPGVGGEAGLAQHAEPGRQRGKRRVDDGGRRGVDHGVVAPAQAVAHEVADREPVGPAGDDPPDGRAVERAADREVGRVVLLGRVHPAAHGRIDAHVDVADQHLAGAGLAGRRSSSPKSAGVGRPSGREARVTIRVVRGMGSTATGTSPPATDTSDPSTEAGSK